MRVVKDVTSTASYGGNFSGAVELSMLRAAPDPTATAERGADHAAMDVAHVHFHDGAATHWHAHPGGQVLYVTDGTGIVGTRDTDAVVLEPGSLVETPAGEWHWHGAAPGGDARILALTWGTSQWTDEPAPTAAARATDAS